MSVPVFYMGPLGPIAVAVMLGALGASASGLPCGVWLGVGAGAAALAWRGRGRRAAAALTVLWICIGALRLAVWHAHPWHRLAAVLPEEAQPIQVHGRLLEEPVEMLAGSPWATEERQATTLELLHVREAAGWRTQPGRLRVVVAAPRVPLAAGDEVLGEGQWQRTLAAGNPGEYDRRAAGARRGLYGWLQVGPADGLVVLIPGRPSFAMRAVSWLRHRWEALLVRAFDEPQTGLWRSLLLGQRVALDETLERAFVETGTIHVLATQCTKLHRDPLANHVAL